MHKQYFTSLLAFLMLFAIGCSSAKNTVEPPRNKWEMLGQKNVNYRLENDVLKVSAHETYQQLRLSVKGGSLNMYRCVVYFENGGRQEVDLRHNFSRGSSSRVIDLEGNRRRIDRIVFWYDTKNQANRKATVSVWGK